MSRLRALARDGRGAAAIEFALIGPAMLAMLLGVLQIGMGMHAYNALRGISGDIGRHVVVEYQKSNELEESQISLLADALAAQAPYMLPGEVEVEVDPVASGLTDVIRFDFTITYTVPSVLDIIGIGEFDVTYSRPIFVSANS